MTFNLDQEIFFFGNAAPQGIIAVNALNYTDLTTNHAASYYHTGTLATVLTGEEEFFSSQVVFWTAKKFKYPKGFYHVVNNIDADPANNTWEFLQDYTISSLKTLIIAPNIDWTAFYNASPTVEINSYINYNGIIYTNITGSISSSPPGIDTTNWASYIALDVDNTRSPEEGQVAYSADAKTLLVGVPGGSVEVGQEIVLSDRPKNTQGVQINNGQAVYLSGASGAVPEVKLADAFSNSAPRTIAVATQNVPNNQRGRYTCYGIVRDINTLYGSDGDEIFLSATPGGITTDKLDYPYSRVRIGYIIRSHETEGSIFVNIGAEQWLQRFQVIQMPTGFPNRTDSTIAYNPATRTITVTPTDTEFSYFLNAQRYRVTSISETHPDVSGIYFLYYDSSNVLQFSTTFWDIRSSVPISYVVYNSSLADGFILDERHGTDRGSLPWHYSDHFTRGTFYHEGEGLGISGYTLQPASPTNSDNQYRLATGEIHDEDIDFQVSALSTNSYNIFYRNGVSGEWRWSNETIPVFVGTTYITYNEYTGATWQQTEVANNNYVNMYVCVTSALTTGYDKFLIQGQEVYTSLAAAQEETLASLSLGALPFQEILSIYKITFRTSASYTGSTGRCRIEYVEDTRLTTSRIQFGGSVTVNHNSLGGLELAQNGISWGHIDDQTQNIAGEKIFLNIISSSVGRKPTAFFHESSSTDNDLFDALAPYLPNTNDELINIGVINRGGVSLIISRAVKDSTTTIIFYGYDIISGGVSTVTITDGDATAIEASLLW